MKTTRKKSFLTRVFLFLNYLAVLSLLLVYLGVYARPDFFWFLAFPGLLYPVILLVNIFFVLLWLFKLRIYFIISLLAIALGWNHLQTIFQYNDVSKPLPGEGKNISIVSYNVRVFDLYNYGPNWQLNFSGRNNIFRFLQQQEFDIVCFQEFVHDAAGSFKTLDTLPRIMKARYSHTGFARSSKDVNFFGLATFSAYPIIYKGQIDFPSNMGNMGIFSDIKIGSDTIRVYNVHFESIGLSPEDYVFVENITNTQRITDHKYFTQGSLRILRRIRNAFLLRAEQVEMVTQHLEKSPYPVVLAGDFNDTPASWSYHKMTQLLNDAFKSGKGYGQTYIGSIPGFRIDYIMHSDDFTPYNFTTGDVEYSDHYPIWVWLNLE